MKKIKIKLASLFSIVAFTLILILSSLTFSLNNIKVTHGGNPYVPGLLGINGIEVAHGGNPYVPGLLGINGIEVTHGGNPYEPGLLNIKNDII